MRMSQLSLVALCVLGGLGSGCGTPKGAPSMRSLLGRSIAEFSQPMGERAPRTWIHNMDDNACDRGWTGPAAMSAGKAAKEGNVFGLGGGARVASSGNRSDGLAFEVFTNYLTQNNKARVVEPHRHNYATSSNAATHAKVDVVNEKGQTTSWMSPEDLCALDEAKKRSAEKVLAYQILGEGPALLIHLRLSDVPTGVVELSRTLRVTGSRVDDWSIESANPSAKKK
jgi:hypothetical protein